MGDFKDYLKNKYGSEGAQQESDFSVYTFKKKKKKKKNKKEKRKKALRRPNIEVDSVSASAWGRPKQAAEPEVKLVQPKLIDQKKSNVKTFIPKVADGSGWKVVTASEPRETQEDSDSDQEVVPRRRHDSDDSDQEVVRQHDSDSDQEVPTQRPHDSSDSDQEIAGRHDSDDSDQEVPRKRVRHDSDSEPEEAAEPAQPPPQEESEDDSDQDIPRRGHEDDSDSDQEIPRPGSKRKMEQSDGAPDAKRKAAAKQVIHRDKNGKIMKMSEREKNQKEWEDRHNLEWGAGIKQKFDREDAIRDYAKGKTETLARYEDDFEMNQMLEEKNRWGDPLLEFGEKKTKKKKKKKETENKLKERPRFQGKACFNRFGIPPGYRWDGIDRGNGYEVLRNKRMAEMGRNVTRDYMSERADW